MRNLTLSLGLPSLLLIIACLMGIPCASQAQSKQASWESLNSLRAGQKIEVIEMSLKKHTGAFMIVSEEVIQLREGAVEQAVKKENVMRVTLMENHHRLRNTLVLTVVGGGVGAGIGTAAGSDTGFIKRKGAAAIGAVIGLVGGAAVGAALPAHETVYRTNSH